MGKRVLMELPATDTGAYIRTIYASIVGKARPWHRRRRTASLTRMPTGMTARGRSYVGTPTQDHGTLNRFEEYFLAPPLDIPSKGRHNFSMLSA